MKKHSRQETNALELAQKFETPPPGYGEVAFYWWLGDPLTRERLAWQMDRVCVPGVSGLQINYAHSDEGGKSYGLTYVSDPPLMSEAWWELFDWFLGEAKRRGVTVSLSDYTLGVGQGFYMDEVLAANPDCIGATLASETMLVSSDQTVATHFPDQLLSVVAYRLENEKIAPDSAIDLRDALNQNRLHWTAPEGDWKIIAVSARPDPLSLDPMNPKSGPEVAAAFFQKFEERAPGEAGKTLDFFFSDELDFGIRGRLWNDKFAQEFLTRKGYELAPLLPALFEDIGPITAKVRLDYNDVLVSLSEEGFFRPVFEWHERRGMTFGCDHGGRGQDVTEFGDYFRTQRWTQGPGCDQPRLGSGVVKPKVAASIAHLYERPRVWLEGFYSSGWGTTAEQVADATYKNYALGHNLLSLHGLYYSTHGGWWEWAPPCNHFRMPYWPHLQKTLRCVERLSFLMSQGVHQCDVAVMYPVAPVEAGMDGEKAVKTAFEIGEALYKNEFDFDFMDFESLERAEIIDQRLAVSGERYRALVLPNMRAARFSTVKKAQEFFEAGGIVIALGSLPEASDRAGSSDPVLDQSIHDLFGISAPLADTLNSALYASRFRGRIFGRGPVR